ncbi:protein SOSEKI 3 [Musa acuminata AAA Group]|uniref:protein SOSEKI 3 n=1 Tax=Musa acuminata AAA Group TaxID=214697 RepID=UPI0031DBEEBC
MDARMMRRHASQASPERSKVWTEPALKQRLQERHRGGKIPVVYYLCRNRHLEHPHFIEVPLSSPEGLYLRDVIDRLNVLRGKGMAAMYSWSSKRSYKNGFVWHDLSEDDLILPSQGNEYVLKGSELLDQTPPDRNSDGISNGMTQNLKYPMQEPPTICYKGQEASCSSSSAMIMIREPMLPPPSPKQPTPPHSPAAQGYVLCPSACRSGSLGNFSPKPGARTSPPSALGSPNPMEYRICKPIGAQDASTQTDDRGSMSHGSITRIVGVPTDDRPRNEQTMCSKEELETNNVERSPPLTLPSDPSCGKMNTLESLIRDEVSRRNNFRIMEAEEVFLPNRSKFKATNMLMHLITCGSTSVKDHYGLGFMPTYRTRFTGTSFASPLSANSMVLGGINGLPESRREIGVSLKKKGHFSGSMIETNKYKEEIVEGVSSLKRSSSFGEERNHNMPHSRRNKEKEADSAQLKCLPSTMKITSCTQSRDNQNGTLMSQISEIMGNSSSKFSPLNSSYGENERIIDKGSSVRSEFYREEKEKVIKIEESLNLELGS